MSEEEFKQQEQKRLKLESIKQSLKSQPLSSKTPIPSSVEEFLQVFQSKLSESPLLQEYIRREHAENKLTIETLRRHYAEKLEEQEADIASLRAELAELRDNFNIFASKLLKQGEERLEILRHAALTLERELSR